MMRFEHRSEDVWHDEAAGPLVRPYAMTRGRTEPSRGGFDLISLVAATRAARHDRADLAPEHRAIMKLCQSAVSVAEISAHLDLPLGIVRVMLSDLLDEGLILAREPQRSSEPPPDHVVRAVINGLRSL